MVVEEEALEEGLLCSDQEEEEAREACRGKWEEEGAGEKDLKGWKWEEEELGWGEEGLEAQALLWGQF